MQQRFHAAFSTLPKPLQTALRPYLDTANFTAQLTADQITAIKQQCALDNNALALALLPLAAAYALTPISHFQVGAIAHGISGNFYFGANMEFTGFPLQQTVHAEQCAVTNAWLAGEERLAAITVNYTPCGHCRQFLNELNSGSALQIHLPTNTATTLAHYLPDSFGPQDLAVTSSLLDHIDHGYSLPLDDELAQAALDAANRSHAPYSKAHSGIALEASDGSFYLGRYAENAAFNPSLPPLQSALIMMNLAGADSHAIQRAVLAEPTQAPISQWQTTQSILSTLGCRSIKRILF